MFEVGTSGKEENGGEFGQGGEGWWGMGRGSRGASGRGTALIQGDLLREQQVISIFDSIRQNQSLYRMKFCKLANIQGQEEADPAADENHQPNLPLPTPTKQPPPALPQEEAYRADIEDYLLAHAPPAIPHPNYFPSQPDLSEHMRGVLLNWLVQVNQKYKLMDETFFLTVKIIDAYLRTQPLTRNKLQLLGITALWIAAKFQETYQVPKVENLVYICDSAYSVPDILAMEGKVLTAVGFDLLAAPSPLLYFKLLQHHALLSEKDYWLARYLLEATAFEITLQKYSPSVLVYSLVFFIKKLRGDSTAREEKVRGVWRAGESEIRTVARELCRLWQRTEHLECMNSLKNKYSQKEFMEVSRIRLTERNK